jgi:prolyl-tRNA synthetase
LDRDLKNIREKITVTDIASARDNDPCPACGHAMKAERGIEVGNIFQLGTKYSESMNCTFLDQNGKSQTAVMGCYGIGVGRSMASVIEQSHDKYGPIWPLEIAPYHVHICGLNLNEPSVKAVADQLYQDLIRNGIEVLYDDRNEKAGAVFNDADLIGVPYRVIVSKKTVAAGSVEFKDRAGKIVETVAIAEVCVRIREMIQS